MYRSLIVLLCLVVPCGAETWVADFENVIEDQPDFFEFDGAYGPFQWEHLRPRNPPSGFQAPEGDYFSYLGLLDETSHLSQPATVYATDGYATINGGWFMMNPNVPIVLTFNSGQEDMAHVVLSTENPRGWEYVDIGNLPFRSVSFTGCSLWALAGLPITECINNPDLQAQNEVIADGIEFSFFNVEGDANDDGAVDLMDLNGVRNEFGASEPVYDANDDGLADLGDLNAVRNFFGTDVKVPAGAPQSVPEPASFVIASLAIAGLAITRFRRAK